MGLTDRVITDFVRPRRLSTASQELDDLAGLSAAGNLPLSRGVRALYLSAL